MAKPKRKCPFPSTYMAKIGRRAGMKNKRKRGKAYFSKISRMRKHNRGGRKPRDPEITSLD